MGKLDGKVAIITGAARGIGRGLALALGKEGARVVVVGRSSNIDPVVEAIRKDGGTAIGALCDVGVKEQVRRTVELAVREFGQIDVMINNAQSFGGTKGAKTPTPEMTALEIFPEEWWDITFQTGLKATLYFMQAVFPHMKDRGGKIINFASAWGLVGKTGTADYNCCKEAIRALTRTAAREWGKHKINVNVICPFIESDSMADQREMNPMWYQQTVKAIPVRFVGTAEQHAGPLAVFLSCSDSDYITGHTFLLDGGMNMQCS